MNRALISLALLFACDATTLDPAEVELEAFERVSCDPEMHVFPVAAPHNIGYDHASCGSGTCQISCPDANANSDWGGAHHGIDVFAYQGAPLVAVADGQIVAVGTPSATSGLRVRLQDGCGWEYYYGHMDTVSVSVGQWVTAGQQIGTMGRTGTSSTHLHFNISPDGAYSSDINPFPYLAGTSETACGGTAPTADPEPDPSEPPDPGVLGCGLAHGTTVLAANDTIPSCDGRFTLYMQGDGNLVLYRNGGGALWSTETWGQPGNVAVMQDDGNLVVYSASGHPRWSSGTHGNPGAVLAMQDDGNLVIYKGSSPLWSSGTCCH